MNIRVLIQGLAAALVFSGTALAAPITGTPLISGDTWTTGPASTNLANYNLSQAGTNRPYVLLDSADADSVTLDFSNLAAGLAYFEVRIDGIATGSSPHPIVTGDTIHSGISVASGTEALGQIYPATEYVDVRLALGGEADYRFDWVRFEVLGSNDIPLPGTLLLLGLGALGVGLTGRRRH